MTPDIKVGQLYARSGRGIFTCPDAYVVIIAVDVDQIELACVWLNGRYADNSFQHTSRSFFTGENGFIFYRLLEDVDA